MALTIFSGDPFPPFSFPDRTGVLMSRESLRGKYAVVYFYPKDNTPGCTLEAQEFTRHLDAFREAGAVVVGVSTDAPRAHERFCAKYDLRVTLLSDADGALGKKLGVLNTLTKTMRRTTFLLDPAGNVVRIWESVTPKGHATDVLETLRRVQGEHAG